MSINNLLVKSSPINSTNQMTAPLKICVQQKKPTITSSRD